MRISIVEGLITSGGSTILPPTNMWPGAIDSAYIKFQWWPSGSGNADSYNLYRTDLSSVTPIKTGIVPVLVPPQGAVAQLFYEDFAGNPDTAALGGTIAPNTTYTYFVTAVQGGTQSAPGPNMTVTTLANGKTATLPNPVTNPSTYLPAYSLPPTGTPTTGTLWLATVTSGETVNGTAGTANTYNSKLSVNCGAQYAAQNAVAGDVIVLTAGATYTSTIGVSGAFWLPNVNGPGYVYYISSEDPAFKVGGKLPALSNATNPNYSKVTLAAAPGVGATSAQLLSNWAGRNAYFPVVFYTGSPAFFETRLVHFVAGSPTINWNTGLGFAATQTTILVHQGNYVTPDDIATSMPTIQFTQSQTVGLFTQPQTGFIRVVGINIQPAPGSTLISTACFSANAYPNTSTNYQPSAIITNVMLDRCVLGNDTTVTGYSFCTRGVAAIGSNMIASQCFFYGFLNGAASDTQAYYAQGGGPHLIQNCYLEAGAENFFTGGVYVPQAQIPHDITIRDNYSHKNGAWVGTAFGRELKNHFETKCGQRFEIYRNIFQNMWYSVAGSGQNGRIGQHGSLDQSAGIGTRNINSLTWSAANGGTGTAVVAFMGPVAVGTNFQTTITGVTPAGWNGTYIGTITAFDGSTTTYTFSLATNPGANGAPSNPPTPMRTTTFPQTLNPWNVVSDSYIHDNQSYGTNQPYYFHTEAGIYNTSGKSMRFKVSNNLIWLNPAGTDNNNTLGQIRGLQVSSHTPDVTYDHNTEIEIPQNTGYLAPGSGFFTSGVELFSATQSGIPNFGYIDRLVITNNYLDGGEGVNVSAISQGFQGSGQGALTTITTTTLNVQNLLFSNNAMTLDATSYSSYLPNTNPSPYSSSGFANFTANTFMPQSPSDWNITSGILSTGSTTGGPIGCSFAGQPTWKTLPVGGGGFVRSLVVAPDGTMIGRTDTAGAYIFNGISWNQLINPSSMPASYIATDPTVLGGGVYEVAICNSNTQVVYMNFNNRLWVSTNQGNTWTQLTAWGTSSANPNNGGASQIGQKMAVDPNNSNIVYIGIEGGGLRTTSNGGSSFTTVSAVPAGSGEGVVGIVFDPNGGVVSGVTQTIYACSQGHGYYVTTNGGTTWTLTSGGPTSVQNAAMDAASNLYAVSSTGVVMKRSSGIWTSLVSGAPNTYQSVAINPFNNSQIAAIDQAGQPNFSNNGGTTWTGQSYGGLNVSSPDIPWEAAANHNVGQPTNIFLDVGNSVFSPLTNGRLITSAGTGMWFMTVPATPTNGAGTWNDFSVGIENLVPNEVIVPPGSGPVIASWDRPFFFLSPPAYPSTYGPVISATVVPGWSVDYASSSPSFVCGITNNGGVFTTNAGASWSNFAATPTGAPTAGGCIAASTPSNIIWAPNAAVAPSFTTNGGTSWTQISIAGITSWSGFIVGNNPNRRITADRVNATTFYLYFPGHGVYITTNGGSTWTQQFSGTIDPNANNSYQNPRIQAVPTQAGNLFYTSGAINGNTSATNQLFYRSTNSGVTWTAVANVKCVACCGFGAPATGQTYPSIHISGFVNGVLGLWRSDDNCVTWVNTGTYPGPNGLFTQVSMAGDMNNYGTAYVGLGGFGNAGFGAGASYAYLSI